jgi:alkanesulfonate monooxygenase SsuD/methylene tetrahydromethanopterin reductase-like flavin-dependent oxidoreductase (luciferase family)
MRFALHVPNFAEPGELVELGVEAEASGWDGMFLWDHVFGGPAFPVPMADPWVVLGALAVRTSSLRLGTAVTPLARRRPQKVAREAVTVDRLSGGRMVLGVGLGNPPEEYSAFGEPAERSTAAARLDEALEVVTGLWSGEPFDHDGAGYTVRGARFLPPPVQQPRIPVWAAAVVPHRAPLVRAARWDGLVLAALDDTGGIDPLAPDRLRDALAAVGVVRGSLDGFDAAVVTPGLPPAGDLAAYEELGATWVLATGWMEQVHELAGEKPPG